MTAVPVPLTIRGLPDRLRGFNLSPDLARHVDAVVAALPDAVRGDLLDDPTFSICEVDPLAPFSVPMSLPGRAPARSVVLKRSLLRRPASFVRWVIAHELAHAYLRNEGRHPAEDPEVAADALAAEWGFARPAW